MGIVKVIDCLVQHLKGGTAFMPLEEILKDVSVEQAGKQIQDLPYTFYQIVEHLRIAQKDILDYCTNPEYKELNWPDDYWPKITRPADEESWQKTKADFFTDRQVFIKVLQDSEESLFDPLANGPKHHLYREALLIMEHNAYHIGQLMVLKRLL